MSIFLETDIGEQEKYENRIHTSVGLRREIKFENRVKNKDNFSLSKIFLF